MLFGIIRIVFVGFVFIAGLLIIRKSKAIQKKKIYYILAALTMVLYVVVYLFPFENAFVTFPSAESAYKYSNRGTIDLVVDGNESTLVVNQKDETSVYTILPKSDKGWKIGFGMNSKSRVQKVYGSVFIEIYRYKDSDDYYVKIFDTDGGETEIYDNHNSEFYHLEHMVLGESYYTYYACINGFDDSYTITVNGTEITFTE